MTVKNYARSGKPIEDISTVTIDLSAWPELDAECRKVMAKKTAADAA